MTKVAVVIAWVMWGTLLFLLLTVGVPVVAHVVWLFIAFGWNLI